MTVTPAAWRSDGDEYGIGVRHRRRQIPAEPQAAGGNVVFHEGVEARLEDR